MLLLHKRLSLIIKLKFFDLESYSFYTEIGFLLSPVYKHLKGIFEYTRNEKGTRLKKTSNA